MGALQDGGVVEVFLVDVHPVVRDGARAQLREAGGFRVVGETGSASAALAWIDRLRPHVAVTDLRLTDGGGLELVRQLRTRGLPTRCLVLTSASETEAYYQAVLAGADGLVLKEQGREEFVHAVRVLAGGGQAFAEGFVGHAQQRAEHNPRHGLLADLTQREWTVLELVAEGMTNREIAARLSIAEKTVRNNVSNVLAKVGMKNRTQVAAYVAGLAAWSDPR